MKVGVYISIADVQGSGSNLQRIVDEAIEEAVLAEEMGFDACFFGEHHQDRDGFLPSPLIVAAAVAARTQRIKIGTSVLLLPLYHPVHVAEDVATLDILSKGRIILGVGLGYQAPDFAAFNIPQKEARGRLEEGIEVIRHCWTGEPFTYNGKHFQLDNVRCLPTPVQRPGPPLWVGGSVPASIKRAAKVGDAWISTPSTTRSDTVDLREIYESALSEGPGQVVLMKDAWVAPTKEAAFEEYGPYVVDAYKYYWRAGLPDFQYIKSESEITIENMAPNRMVVGSPEECIGEFNEWKESTGSDNFVLRLRQAHSGGPPHGQIMDAIQRFGREVLPYLN